MPTIWAREFTGGLDVRRMQATTPGGVLLRARNAHITRGGEVEQRAAFVAAYELPEGETVGLAAVPGGLVTFGSGAEPSGMPAGVAYQQLQHPTDSGLALDAVTSETLFASLLYVSALYTDGSRAHFYDGAAVDDWFDGRARGSFEVTGGATTAATAATASFRVLTGADGVDTIDDVTVNGVSIVTGGVTFTTDAATTAGLVAAAIDAATSSPNYTADADGDTVTITAAVTGPAANNRVVEVSTTGATVSTPGPMTGGADEVVSSLASLVIGGVDVIWAPVAWAGTREATASAIAAAINATPTSPDYQATAVAATVNVVADNAGTALNGAVGTPTGADGLTTSGAFELSGGADSDEAFTPGPMAMTLRSKVWAVAGPLLHSSGVAAPTEWTTDAVGAGFTDLSTEDADAADLVSLARYQNLLAVFAENVVVIRYVDPDPTLDNTSQVLANTGTRFARSVVRFGDTDVFYLDASGLRSLRARDSSNVAATTDIGTPVDVLIAAAAAAVAEGDENRVIALINPTDKRFWLIVGDTIYVFTFYENAKVSAWSTYEPGFSIDAAVVWNRRVWVRSGDTVYVYGGTGDDLTYDEDVEAEVWLPFLDGDNPHALKRWQSYDAAVQGVWDVALATDPEAPDEEIALGRINRVTYNGRAVPANHQSAQASLRFRSVRPPASGPAVLGSAALHYTEGQGR